MRQFEEGYAEGQSERSTREPNLVEALAKCGIELQNRTDEVHMRPLAILVAVTGMPREVMLKKDEPITSTATMVYVENYFLSGETDQIAIGLLERAMERFKRHAAAGAEVPQAEAAG